jgi:hypothetical protein
LAKLLTIAAMGAALALAACGDDSDEAPATPPEETAVSPQQAVEEIASVRRGLDQALGAYEEGDVEAADEAASEAYLEHFELVEGPLEEADEELNEELEVEIREELRAAIQDDAPVAQVERLVAQIDRGLDRAEATLEKAA